MRKFCLVPHQNTKIDTYFATKFSEKRLEGEFVDPKQESKQENHLDVVN